MLLPVLTIILRIIHMTLELGEHDSRSIYDYRSIVLNCVVEVFDIPIFFIAKNIQ